MQPQGPARRRLRVLLGVLSVHRDPVRCLPPGRPAVPGEGGTRAHTCDGTLRHQD